jgi:predicted nucleic acid-binding Zn ribbon protein
VSTWRADRPPRWAQDPKPLAASLDRVARRIGAPPTDVLGAVFARWADLVGDAVADHARPLSLRYGVLTIAVDQPAWATQLRLLSGDLLGRLADLGDDGSSVRELRITVRPTAPPGRP